MNKFRKRLRTRIFRGIALLDSRDPTWHKSIQVSTMNLRRNGNDILGMVYGTFEEGLYKLDLSKRGSIHYGFHIHTTPWNIDRRWYVCTEMWREAFLNYCELKGFDHPESEVLDTQESYVRALEKEVASLRRQLALPRGEPIEVQILDRETIPVFRK